MVMVDGDGRKDQEQEEEELGVGSTEPRRFNNRAVVKKKTMLTSFLREEQEGY